MGDDVADSDSYITFEPEDAKECIGLMQHCQDFSVPLSGTQTVEQIASDRESVLSIDNEPSIVMSVNEPQSLLCDKRYADPTADDVLDSVDSFEILEICGSETQPASDIYQSSRGCKGENVRRSTRIISKPQRLTYEGLGTATVY